MAAEAEQLAEVLRALLKAELLKNDTFFKFRGDADKLLSSTNLDGRVVF